MRLVHQNELEFLRIRSRKHEIMVAPSAQPPLLCLQCILLLPRLRARTMRQTQNSSSLLFKRRGQRRRRARIHRHGSRVELAQWSSGPRMRAVCNMGACFPRNAISKNAWLLPVFTGGKDSMSLCNLSQQTSAARPYPGSWLNGLLHFTQLQRVLQRTPFTARESTVSSRSVSGRRAAWRAAPGEPLT